jgi:hypothetical protein
MPATRWFIANSPDAINAVAKARKCFVSSGPVKLGSFAKRIPSGGFRALEKFSRASFSKSDI